MISFGQQNVEEVVVRRLKAFSFTLGAYSCNISDISTLILPCCQEDQASYVDIIGHMKSYQYTRYVNEALCTFHLSSAAK